jgi:hypothetical protein
MPAKRLRKQTYLNKGSAHSAVIQRSDVVRARRRLKAGIEGIDTLEARSGPICTQGGQPSQVCDACLSPVHFAARLGDMRRWTFRQVCLLMLGLFVALGLNLSAVQAGNMAASMTMSDHQMSAKGMTDCSGCKDVPGDAKMAQCDATCVAPTAATLPQIPALLFERPVDRPLSQNTVVSDWTASPNPHPPQFIISLS